MTQLPKVRQLGRGSMTVRGDGWTVQIRVVGWWRPRLLVHVYQDGPEPEIPYRKPRKPSRREQHTAKVDQKSFL